MPDNERNYVRRKHIGNDIALRKVLLRTGLLMLLLTLAVAITVFVARERPAPGRISWLNLDACQLPCWIGITPGKTTFGEAKRLLSEFYSQKSGVQITHDQSLGYILSSQTQNYSIIVDFAPDQFTDQVSENSLIFFLTITLQGSTYPRFGELLPYLPQITYVDIAGSWELYAPGWQLQGATSPSVSCFNEAIRPNDRVVKFTLSSPVNMPEPEFLYKWQGFRSCYR